MSDSKEMGKRQLRPLGETELVLWELGEGAQIGQCLSPTTLYMTDALFT